MYLDSINWSAILLNVVLAIVILLATWLLAGLVKSLLTKGLSRITVLQRTSDNGKTIAASLASIGSLLVWLFGLIAVLNLFNLTGVLTPIQQLLNGIMGYLPNILGAGIIFFLGLVVAKIVRDLTVTALQTVNADRWLRRLGQKTESAISEGVDGDAVPQTANTLSLSKVLGQLLFAAILVVVSIAALQVLNIQAISQPATTMLETILNAIPAIIGAGILLTLGVFIARFVASLLAGTLRGTGFNAFIAKLGFEPKGRDAAGILGLIVTVAIVLFFAIAATRMLGFPEITAMLDSILVLTGRIMFGGVVIAAGVFVAGLLAKMVSNASVGSVVRWGTIILFVAMGLKFMGVADSIVNLAFGALVVGAAAAAALAFGLGGRDAAARELKELQDRKAANKSS
ncbi:mechanosensitive ion channel [Microbacterium sp.]|uniref:mechanosensitive ion channel n=1 Tax=Microbacterium sp. TaxID=51671 RepID=UPI003A85213C